MDFGSIGWSKRLLLWALIGAGVFLVASMSRVSERMGCEPLRRGMQCRHSLLSPETWRALPAR